MPWEAQLEELERRTRMAHAMGGADKVKRQHDGGRLTVRERIDRLVDPAPSTRSARSPGKASTMPTATSSS